MLALPSRLWAFNLLGSTGYPEISPLSVGAEKNEVAQNNRTPRVPFHPHGAGFLWLPCYESTTIGTLSVVIIYEFTSAPSRQFHLFPNISSSN